MPLLNRRQLPEVGEVVVGTVKEIYDYGAYLILEDYNGLRAFLPWSEVSNRSFRSISEVIKVNERVAVKVIRVDRAKGHVDVSLKRVTDDERRSKMTWWKRTQKAVNIILMVAKELGKGEREAYEEVIWKLEDRFGDVMAGLEAAALEGEKPLLEAGVGGAWVKALVEASKKYVELKRFRASLVLTLRSDAPDGVERIREVLKAISGSLAKDNVAVRVYAIGSPRYRVDLMALDARELEGLVEQAQRVGAEEAKRRGVEFSAQRVEE